MSAARRPLPQRVRIIGGSLKRSALPVLDRPGLRPTPQRVRETLFNWLGQDLTGWACLDAFAGTGVLGFEALAWPSTKGRTCSLARALASTASPKRAVLKSEGITMSLATPERCVDRPPGRKKSAVVILSSPSRPGSSTTVCTVPFPKVWSSPTITARP